MMLKESSGSLQKAAVSDDAPELAKAADLLYQLIDASFQCSGNCLETEINGNRESLQGLYWGCKDLLERVTAHPDKTGFLAMSAIEQYWRWSKPLLLCRVEDLLDGTDGGILKMARELEQLLEDNPDKKAWAERYRRYTGILESVGFAPDAADFSDLTKIMDPLMDALVFYEKPVRGQGVSPWLVRDGAPSGTKRPSVATAMCMYSSEKEFVDAVMSSGREALVAFGAIEKTHRQMKDYFFEWYHGFPEERQRNMMRNDNLTEEEYLDSVCDYTRSVKLCVKDGSRCWLVTMPWHGDTYATPGQEGSEYRYGKRASYAPYQIFYKRQAAPAPAGTTMLAVDRRGWLLTELLDQMSMAWFPAFIDETIKTFFREPEGLTDTPMLLPEEAVLDMGDGAAEKFEAPGFAIVPASSHELAAATWSYHARSPEEAFQDEPEWLKGLFRYFNISEKDLAGVPLLPQKPGTAGSYDKHVQELERKAYIKALAAKIADLCDSRWDARKFCLWQIGENEANIINAAGDGDLIAFMSVKIEGTPILDKDGNQKTESEGHYPYRTRPAAEHVDPNDAREYRSGPENTGHRVLWASPATRSKPSVCWYIRPRTAEDYAAMFRMEVKDLPEVLRLAGPISDFYAKYRNMLPDGISNQWTGRGYGDRTKSCYLPCLAAVNVCMNRTAHRSFPYFNDGTKKKGKKT